MLSKVNSFTKLNVSISYTKRNSQLMNKKDLICSVECMTIPFKSAEYASLACDVLNVDKELKGSGVSRNVSTNSEILVINLNGQDLKRLRVSANSIIKSIILITKTFNQFEQN